MNRCFECDSVNNVVLHHVVPESRGGSRTIPVCQLCHDKIHGRRIPRNISISSLTREGIAKAKLRGVKLGNPKPKQAWLKAMTAVQKRKEKFYSEVMPYIEQIRSNGIYKLQDIANELNRCGIETSRKKKFTSSHVFNIINGDPSFKSFNTKWTATAVKRIVDLKK